jgi:hypothetical protein
VDGVSHTQALLSLADCAAATPVMLVNTTVRATV